jgi:hypothetical protein
MKKACVLMILILIPAISSGQIYKNFQLYQGYESNPYQINSDSAMKGNFFTQLIVMLDSDEELDSYYYYRGDFLLNHRYSDLNYYESKLGISQYLDFDGEKWDVYTGAIADLFYAPEYLDGDYSYGDAKLYLDVAYVISPKFSLYVGDQIKYRAYFQDYFANFGENNVHAELLGQLTPQTTLSLKSDYFYRKYDDEDFRLEFREMGMGIEHGEDYHFSQEIDGFSTSYMPNNSQLAFSSQISQAITDDLTVSAEYIRTMNFSDPAISYIASGEMNNPYIIEAVDDHYSYISDNFYLTINAKFPYRKLSLDFYGEYLQQSYPNRLALNVDGEPRINRSEQEDNIWMLGISAIKKYDLFWQPFLSIYADYSYTNSDSNDQRYDYHAHVIRMGMGIEF